MAAHFKKTQLRDLLNISTKSSELSTTVQSYQPQCRVINHRAELSTTEQIYQPQGRVINHGAEL
jgi:hypothetical protein